MSELIEKPCKCGYLISENPKEHEIFHMKMGKVFGQELPLRPTHRCRTCKEVCIVERIEDIRSEIDPLENLNKIVSILQNSRMP